MLFKSRQAARAGATTLVTNRRPGTAKIWRLRPAWKAVPGVHLSFTRSGRRCRASQFARRPFRSLAAALRPRRAARCNRSKSWPRRHPANSFNATGFREKGKAPRGSIRDRTLVRYWFNLNAATWTAKRVQPVWVFHITRSLSVRCLYAMLFSIGRDRPSSGVKAMANPWSSELGLPGFWARVRAGTSGSRWPFLLFRTTRLTLIGCQLQPIQSASAGRSDFWRA